MQAASAHSDQVHTSNSAMHIYRESTRKVLLSLSAVLISPQNGYFTPLQEARAHAQTVVGVIVVVVAVVIDVSETRGAARPCGSQQPITHSRTKPISEDA